MRQTAIAIVLLCSTSALASPFRVVIDAGHGGSNTGAPGRAPGAYEKQVTLKIARALERKLKAAGAEVVMTRDHDQYLTIRERARRGPAAFHLLTPNLAEHAALTEAEREHRQADGERMLELALPVIQQAAGGAAEGSVSYRHDPMDAIEEALHDGEFHELILSTLPHSVSSWLHLDLPHRVSHLGVPVTTVVAQERSQPPRSSSQPAHELG